ncbi:di-N-acetylchitobiase-like [Mustelus asterias]
MHSGSRTYHLPDAQQELTKAPSMILSNPNITKDKSSRPPPVIMNVPWSPDCTDGRCYDFVTLAKFCDFLLVMPSDFNIKMGDDCFAKASVPYHQTYAGLAAYIRLGIDARKLITGVPWFGYDYPCTQLFEPGRCKLQEHYFGGSRCSSSVAKPILYKQVMQLLPKSVTGRHWDGNSESPYFVYKVNNTFHEVWYDDPESISLRSTIVRKLNLGGVGAWFGNSLNYSVNLIAAMQTEEMWNALYPMQSSGLTCLNNPPVDVLTSEDHIAISIHNHLRSITGNINVKMLQSQHQTQVSFSIVEYFF